MELRVIVCSNDDRSPREVRNRLQAEVERALSHVFSPDNLFVEQIDRERV